MDDQLLVVIQQPEVSRMLKLSDSQQQAIRSVLQNHAKALSDIRAGADTTAQISNTTAQLTDTLTSQQKTQLSEMLSRPGGFRYEDENTKVIVTGSVPEGTPMTRWSASVDGVSLADINDGPIEIPECLRYVVPKRPGHIIALQTGTHKDYTYTIYDLRTQQMLASADLNNQMITDHEDVSADGTRYAFTESERDRATGEYQYWLDVGQFQDGSSIKIPLTDGASGVQFADNETLIAYQKGAKMLAVVDIASKQVKHRIPYPQRQSDEYLVSPGGKFLFVSRAVRNLFVDVYEVHTGQRVGSLVAPTDGEHYVFQSMTISPNGKYLALGSYRAYRERGSQVAVWDMNTGELALKLDRQSPLLSNVSRRSAVITNNGTTVLGMNTAVDQTGSKIIWRQRLDSRLGPTRAYALARNQKLILLGRNAEVFSLPQINQGIAKTTSPELCPEHGLTFAFTGRYLATAFPKMEFTAEQADRINTLCEPLLQMRPLLIEGKVAPATWKAKCVEVGGAIIDTLDDEQKLRHWDSLSSGSSSFFDLDAETARLQPKP